MKLTPVASGEYDPRARRIDRDAACPQCHSRSMVFEDGRVWCVMEGLYFVPEDKDGELFDLQQKYRRNQTAKK